MTKPDAEENVACFACGYRHDAALGRYGCPNCHGEGLAENVELFRPARNNYGMAATAAAKCKGQRTAKPGRTPVTPGRRWRS